MSSLHRQQESDSKLKEDVCSPTSIPSAAPAQQQQPVSHGMSSSELGRVIRADHDYIELLVKVKVEETSSDEEEEIAPEVPIDIKEEVVEADKSSMFDNLSTLAEVSLATAGQLEDKSLKRKIDQARAKISKTILPVTPEQSSKRTMQVLLFKMQSQEIA